MKLCDKYGREIEEFDLLKVFHFTGARRKKYYMYKWVRTIRGMLYALHLEREYKNGVGGGYILPTSGTQEDMEIVQSNNWEKLEKKHT